MIFYAGLTVKLHGKSLMAWHLTAVISNHHQGGTWYVLIRAIFLKQCLSSKNEEMGLGFCFFFPAFGDC